MYMYCWFTHSTQMYKVYRDPEGKSVLPTQQNMTNYTFQCSEEMYKVKIENLTKELANLKNKVSSSHIVSYRLIALNIYITCIHVCFIRIYLHDF